MMPLETGRIKTLWVREGYLAQILDGRKTVEVRVGYDNIRNRVIRFEIGGDDNRLTGKRFGSVGYFPLPCYLNKTNPQLF